MHDPDDRHLDPAKLISTSSTLAGWIDRDFNHAHLSVVAANVQRLTQEAEGKGANAIVAMRFDTSELGSTWTEICAYGTAVRIRKS